MQHLKHIEDTAQLAARLFVLNSKQEMLLTTPHIAAEDV